MAPSEARTGRRLAQNQSTSLTPGSAVPFDTVLSTITAGQTVAAAGAVRNDISLGQGALLTEPTGVALSIFGTLAGPASGLATLAIAAGATLYAAGPVGAALVAAFSGAAGTLELADIYLPAMAAAVAGFSPGEVIDIVSGVVTDALLASAGPGGTLSLMDDGRTLSTLALADGAAATDAAFAVPDPIDGTRILLGPAIPATSNTTPAGSAGAAHSDGVALRAGNGQTRRSGAPSAAYRPAPLARATPSKSRGRKPRCWWSPATGLPPC